MSEREDTGPEQGPGNRMAWTMEDFVNQWKGFTDRARGLAVGAVPFSPPRLPSPPGAMSAAQLRAIDKAVRGQRQQIQAMTAQLEAFDDQLEVFERILEPLVEWSSTWARLEETMTGLVRRPGDSADSGKADSGT